jgi:superfamily II DNA/RNA helicase
LPFKVGLPPSGVDYFIHRSGRTGRAGRPGVSVVLHSNGSGDKSILRDIKRKIRITPLAVPDEVKEKFGDDVYAGEEVEDGFYRRQSKKPYGTYKDRARSYSERPNYRNRNYDDENDYQERPYSDKYNNKNRQFKDDGYFNRSKSFSSPNRTFKPDEENLSDK